MDNNEEDGGGTPDETENRVQEVSDRVRERLDDVAKGLDDGTLLGVAVGKATGNEGEMVVQVAGNARPRQLASLFDLSALDMRRQEKEDEEDACH